MRPATMPALLALLALLALAFAAGHFFGSRQAQPLLPQALAEAGERADEAVQEAVQAEETAIAIRPAVEAAMEALEIATETRVRSGLTFDSLPKPIAQEMAALRGLVRAQAEQLEAEMRRGDAWKAAAMASQEHASLLAKEARSAKGKGFRRGLAGGAGAALLLVVLL